MDKLKKHGEICQILNKIYAEKNADYGDSFGKTFEQEGMAVARIRLGDKYNRICTLTRGKEDEQKVKDESVRDTLLDLANYAIMTVIEMDFEKEKEIEKKATNELFYPSCAPDITYTRKDSNG